MRCGVGGGNWLGVRTLGADSVDRFSAELVTAAAKRALCQRANGSLAPSGELVFLVKWRGAA